MLSWPFSKCGAIAPAQEHFTHGHKHILSYPSPGTLRHVDHAHRAGRLGHGRQWLGGGLGPQDDADSIGAIRLAVDRGINWIDTAAVYGLGHSEEIVRRALAQMAPSERPYVFTKCGLTWSDTQPQATPRRTGAPASIRREVEDSLRRLGVERIDLYQMHWPAGDGTSLDGYWETLLALKREGKVGAVGLSNHNLAQLQDAEALGHVDSLQPPFSAIQRSAAADLIPWCEAHGTGVIVYSPMQSGLLSGGFSEARAASCPPMTGVRAMPSSGRPRYNAIWHWRRLSGRSPSVTGDGRRRRGGLDPGLAGRDRRDRRRAQRGAGGRLAGRRRTRAG